MSERLADLLREFEDANVELQDLDAEIRNDFGGKPTRDQMREKEKIQRKIREIADRIPVIIASK
jgi:hypothetical protein